MRKPGGIAMLCDSNVLLALALSKHSHHSAAREWLESGAAPALIRADEPVADEPVELEPVWKKLALRETASPKLWMDAYLAAFALAGRYRMVTTDAAFRQFQA